MAYNETLVAPNTSMGLSTQFLYTTGTDQESVLLPIRDTVGIQLVFTTAGVAKVQATADPYALIIAGTCSWVDWDLGDVSITSQANCHRATGVRVVLTSGTVALTVVV
jgi:hypothetical protein